MIIYFVVTRPESLNGKNIKRTFYARKYFMSTSKNCFFHFKNIEKKQFLL
jgi:hypothetical protein